MRSRVRSRKLWTAVLLPALVSVPAAAAPAQVEAPRARIAYEHAGAIWTIDGDGADRRRVTRGHEPAWSPDGTRIAFTRVGDERSALWVVSPDGSGARRLVKPSLLGQPAWSPDGSQLAFARFEVHARAVVSAIDVVRPDGTGRRTVQRLRSRLSLDTISSPVWSADGRELFYTRTKFRPRVYGVSIRAVALDGTGDRLFLRDAQGGAWSPDGLRFAYGDVRSGNGETCGEDECSPNGELATVDAMGADRRVLTHTKTDESDPSWSPDGGRIAFSSGRNTPELAFGEPEVYSIAPDGTCLTWLTNGSPESGSPSWSGTPGVAGPSACGAAGRRPLVEQRPTPRQRSALWLGPRFGAALFAGSQGRGRSTVIDYEDCGAFDPHACPPMFVLTQDDACGPIRFGDRSEIRGLHHLRWIGNRLLARRRGDDRPLILAGHSTLLVQVDSDGKASERRRLYRRVARGLRRVSGGPVGRPMLPDKLRRLLPPRVRPRVGACPR